MRRVWGLGLLLLAACGGRASHADTTEPEAGGTPSVGGSPPSASGATVNEAGAASGALIGCPDASWASCDDRFLLDLHFDGTSTKTSDAAVWAEPLQLPRFEQTPVTGPSTPVDSANWDRSRLPAGACVFALHGARASCITNHFGRVKSGPCGQAGPPIVPTGYYELPQCAEGIAPGCASADPRLGDNFVWYVVPEADGRDETLLVMCAGLCATFGSTAGATMCVAGDPGP